MRVKVFSAAGATWLEEAMNEWLAKKEGEVVILTIDPVCLYEGTYVSKITYETVEQIFVEVDSPDPGT